MKKKTGSSRAALAALIALLALVIAGVILHAVDGRHVEMRLRGDEHVTVEYDGTFKDPGAELWSVGKLFGARKKLTTVRSEAVLDTKALGDYRLWYRYEDKNGEQKLSRIVSVVDTTPPVITLVDEAGAEQGSWMSGYVEQGYSAYDNRDGDITDRVVCTALDNSVIYTVADEAGNETVAERQLQFSIAAPEILLTGGNEVDVPAAMTFTDPGYQAVDSLGNDYTDMVTVDGVNAIRPWKEGSYVLTYSIANDVGETVTETRTVHIVPAERVETVYPEQPTIYLTFDDGPGPYTGQLLDLLAKYDVKVTFFVTGNYPDYYDMIGRAYREGHAIGVHSFTHNYRQIYASEQAYFDDFNAVEDLIYQQTGTYTNIFRFPGGSSNTVSSFNPGIMGRLATYMPNMGYYYFDWNVSSGDAGSTTSSWGVYENVVAGRNYVQAGMPLVVLQHDIKDFSVAAVENIINWGLNNGYQFLPLDASCYGARHRTAN